MFARDVSCRSAQTKGLRQRLPGSFDFFVRWLLLSAIVVALPPATVAEEPSDRPTITPTDVFARVALVRAEVEALRYYMGKPRNEQPPLGVQGAAPREVYFQALTLFDKADRFCFEQVRQRTAPPEPPAGEPQPEDVLQVVDAALGCVRRVTEHCGVDFTAATVPFAPSKTPTDVFGSIVQANRQLNLLLDQRFAPHDVFQQVTRAVGYAARLLEHYRDAEPLPSEPELQPGKTPGDVYRRLLDCFEKLRAIATAAGKNVLELKVDDALIDSAEPSDVYDIAVLIVAELAHLHAQLPDATPPRAVYYAGRKFPSDVYQRVGILERQLNQLAPYVSSQQQESDE